MARAGWLVVGAVIAGVLGAGCKSSAEPAEASAPAVEGKEPKWKPGFTESTVLAARAIEIVGPRGLLAHVAITHDSANHLHEERVTREGLRIEQTQRPDSDGTPIRAQLDNLTLVADVSLTVLESPGAKQVVVQANGDVYFHVEKTGEERRLESLRLEAGR